MNKVASSGIVGFDVRVAAPEALLQRVIGDANGTLRRILPPSSIPTLVPYPYLHYSRTYYASEHRADGGTAHLTSAAEKPIHYQVLHDNVLNLDFY